MKNLFKKSSRVVFALAACAALSFAACSNSSDNTIPIALTGGTATAQPYTITVLPAGTDGSLGTSGTYVTFGSWPQTIMASGVTVNESESKAAGAFTYYKGSDNCWYAKLAENAYRNSYTYSDGTTVGQGGTAYKYFKVEPIKWRVLTDNYSGKKLLLAESVLIGKRYDDDLNNYMNSEIRAWLNDGFLNAAFTSSEKEAIATTAVDNTAASTTDSGNNIAQATSYACENTSDKIFLLSELEATTSAYGFAAYDERDSARIRVTTDYAKASGAYQSGSMSDWWWLRSPYHNRSDSALLVNSVGSANDHINDVTFTYGGVVPALSIN